MKLIGIHSLGGRDLQVIVGIGTDIVEIVRIARLIERHGEQFLNRVYTADEVRYCQRHKNSNQHFAGRWAAKEAVMKTFGTGFTRGIHWQDIEIVSRRSGEPVVRVHGGAEELAGRLRIDRVLITISHCRAYATATAIALRDTTTDGEDDVREAIRDGDRYDDVAGDPDVSSADGEMAEE